jgi:hypothetical protein
MVYEDPTFFIKSGDVGFADRQKSIFDKLTVAEKERNERQQEADHHSENNNILSTGNCVPSVRRGRSEMKQFRGKESIFKRPVALPPRFKSKDVPDYHRNPHKWIKYSLGDVSQEDMSDRSNTAAALSFLKELQERKRQQEMEGDDRGPEQITFKQPKNKTKLLTQHDASLCLTSGMTSAESTTGKDTITQPSFRSSKLIMPEYVVGMTKKKDKKKNDKHAHLPQNENITSVIKLQHLAEDDDGE